MISYVFCSSLILRDSLENAIFEHLKWLKLISWKHLVSFLNVSDHAFESKVNNSVEKDDGKAHYKKWKSLLWGILFLME